MKKAVTASLCAMFMITLSLTGYAANDLQDVNGITQEEVEGDAVWLDEYQRFFDLKEEGFIIPGLNQGLVLQDISYIEETSWFVMSNYQDGGQSMITFVDAETDQLVKSFFLNNEDGTPYNGHAGGVAVSNDHLWLASGSHVYYISLDEVINSNDRSITFEGRFKIDARGSFVNVVDGILWVGDFALDTRYPTKETHHITNRDGELHTGWIAGYELDEDTDLIPEGKPKNSDDGSFIPDLVLSIPDKIQQMGPWDDKLALVESYGRHNPSHIYFYEDPLDEPPHHQVELEGISVPVWFLDGHNLTDDLTLTPLAEGFAEFNGRMNVVFESGAEKYRDGSYVLSRAQILPYHVEAQTAAEMRSLVERFAAEGELTNEAARALQLHLTAVDRFEKQEAAEKVVKHMESFKLLLNHLKTQTLISERTYNILSDDATSLLRYWQ